MTRSVEIPEAAAEAVAASLYGSYGAGLRYQDAKPDVQASYREHATEILRAALPYLAPAGDGGLREALEKRKETLRDWVADWPSNKEYGAWNEEIAFIDRTLAAHPAASTDEEVQILRRALREAQDAIDKTKPLLDRLEAAALPVDREALRGKLDQLWGWAKSGKRRDGEGGEYYLMSVENVDGFTDAVLAVLAGGESS